MLDYDSHVLIESLSKNIEEKITIPPLILEELWSVQIQLQLMCLIFFKNVDLVM